MSIGRLVFFLRPRTTARKRPNPRFVISERLPGLEKPRQKIYRFGKLRFGSNLVGIENEFHDVAVQTRQILGELAVPGAVIQGSIQMNENRLGPGDRARVVRERPALKLFSSFGNRVNRETV